MSELSPNDFKQLSDDQNAQAIADCLPVGTFWDGKNVNDSNLRKLLRGFGKETGRIQAILSCFATGYIPNLDNMMIDSWEPVVGIPDSCFTKDGIVDGDQSSLQGRYRDVLIKLGKMNLQTEQDYIDLGAALGVTLSINNSTGGFNQFYWEIILSGTEQLNGWDYDWDFPWGSTFQNLVICIFNKQRPAHTLIKYNFTQ